MAEGESPVDEKVSHQTVRFERPSTHPGERCGNCEHMIPMSVPGRCQTVASPIFSNAWCVRYERK